MFVCLAGQVIIGVCLSGQVMISVCLSDWTGNDKCASV